MRSRAFVLTIVATAMIALFAPMQESVSAQSGTGIVISEFRFHGTTGVSDEFVELFNAGATEVNITGWMIRASNNNSPPVIATRLTIAADPNTNLPTTIKPGCFFLAVNSTGYSGAVTSDQSFSVGFADNGGVGLTTASGVIVDQAGLGTAPAAFGEGTRLTPITVDGDRSYERRPDPARGFVDTNNNAADFSNITPSTPHSSAGPCLMQVAIVINGSVSPATVEQGGTLTVFGTVIPGTIPPSTGVTVIGNLSAVGGSASALFADNGVTPDVSANDKVFTAEVSVPSGTPLGARAITLTATDAQGRSASTTIGVDVVAPAVIYVPHDIQGAGAASPFANGTVVIVRGVVTARKADGFFVQTEPGMEDADTNSSEGLFVFVNGGAPAAAQVGHVVNITGAVAEVVPTADPGSASLTELLSVVAVNDLGASALPAPYLLTSAEVSDAGSLDQLERFEGMRVAVGSLTAVSGTGGNQNDANATSTSDGTFYAVLTGQARPFREPGIESGYPVLPCAIGPCLVPAFDGNPERLRVDSDALQGLAPVNLSTGAVMTNVVGPLDFAFRSYTILPEAPLAPAGGMTLQAAPTATFDQFTIASFNLERFYDTANNPGADVVVTAAAYQTRLAKASLTIRNVLHTPDFVGLQDVENLTVLADLASRIDADAIAAGVSAPQYAMFLFEGNGPDGLDVALLVKQAGGRVSFSAVEQVGKDAMFTNPVDGIETALNDRPPLVLHATVAGPASTLPQTLTLIVNHLQSRAGIEFPDATGAFVRARRRAQAEFLANYVQVLQSNDPGTPIVSIGDYGAFGFNDGYVDSVGTIKGLPASPDQVVSASPDLVSPDLVNVGDLMAATERYSSVLGGNAQTSDHVLISANLASQFAALAYPRVNADFPDVLRGDVTTPSRVSDHDPAVAYFYFPRDVEPPVFSFEPQNQVAEATGPNGAAVSYQSPTADDNLDPFVEVVCAPASGSVFALGNSGVTCSTQDIAGNSASVSFTVTVQDTTAPALTVPGALTFEATSAAPLPVAFAASATDAVTPSPVVNCSAVSGSLFPLGTTTVSCTARDNAGNVSAASFTVTVQDTTAPVLSLPGHLTYQATSSSGAQVLFVALASDAVTASPAVTCTPASGSTFPVGDTLVSCVATDAAGNSSSGSFTVTITAAPSSQLFGQMVGVGDVQAGSNRVWFAFDVRESAASGERGWVLLKVRDGRGRPVRYLSAQVTAISFSNASGYTPGSFPLSGIDTVAFSGIGTWNGLAGYRYEITASDRGEPGRGHDTFSLNVYAPNGQLVESAAGTLHDGNIQSR